MFNTRKVKELQEETKSLKDVVQKLAFQNIVSQGPTINRNVAAYPHWDSFKQTQRYATSDDIFSIINFLSTSAVMIPFWPSEVIDEPSLKELKQFKQPHTQIIKVRKLQKKALQDLDESDDFAELMEQPNPSITKSEFYNIHYHYLWQHGDSFWLKEIPELGVNAGRVVGLHILHPDHVTILVEESFPFNVVGYKYTVNGNVIREFIPAEEIVHTKTFNPSSDPIENKRGFSPLRALAQRFARMDANMDTSVAQVQNGGVETIVYDKSLINTIEAPEIIGQRKDNFYRFVKNKANANIPYFAGGEMGALAIGSTIADMNLIEMANVDFKKVCNAFKISDRLFNNDATGSEVSDDNANKSLYTNAVLPFVYLTRDAWIYGVIPHFKDGKKKRYVREDLSEVKVLQDDILKMMQAIAAAPMFKPNDVLELQGYEAIEDDDAMNKYYVKQGYQLLEDLNAIPVLPNDANDYV